MKITIQRIIGYLSICEVLSTSPVISMSHPEVLITFRKIGMQETFEEIFPADRLPVIIDTENITGASTTYGFFDEDMCWQINEGHEGRVNIYAIEVQTKDRFVTMAYTAIEAEANSFYTYLQEQADKNKRQEEKMKIPFCVDFDMQAVWSFEIPRKYKSDIESKLQTGEIADYIDFIRYMEGVGYPVEGKANIGDADFIDPTDTRPFPTITVYDSTQEDTHSYPQPIMRSRFTSSAVKLQQAARELIMRYVMKHGELTLIHNEEEFDFPKFTIQNRHGKSLPIISINQTAAGAIIFAKEEWNDETDINFDDTEIIHIDSVYQLADYVLSL